MLVMGIEQDKNSFEPAVGEWYAPVVSYTSLPALHFSRENIYFLKQAVLKGGNRQLVMTSANSIQRRFFTTSYFVYLDYSAHLELRWFEY